MMRSANLEQAVQIAVKYHRMAGAMFELAFVIEGDEAVLRIEHLLPSGKVPINLKGFMVGNGYTDWQLDFNANVPNGRYHALTSQSRLDAATQACDGDFARCFWPRPDVDCPAECGAAVQAATGEKEGSLFNFIDHCQTHFGKR